MNDSTARLDLPLLAAGQAQKEIWHNEALALIDLAVAPAVLAIGVDAPPAAPLPGQAWVVGAVPRDAWVGRAGSVAGWTEGGWRFVRPFEGLSIWVVAEKLHASFVDGRWMLGDIRARQILVDGVRVLGSRRPAIPGPTGGASADAEARATLDQVLETLREHGLIAR